MHMGQSFYFLPRISAQLADFVFVFDSCAIVWMWILDFSVDGSEVVGSS